MRAVETVPALRERKNSTWKQLVVIAGLSIAIAGELRNMLLEGPQTADDVPALRDHGKGLDLIGRTICIEVAREDGTIVTLDVGVMPSSDGRDIRLVIDGRYYRIPEQVLCLPATSFVRRVIMNNDAVLVCSKPITVQTDLRACGRAALQVRDHPEAERWTIAMPFIDTATGIEGYRSFDIVRDD